MLRNIVGLLCPLIISPFVAHAAVTSLPVTGQTVCYDEANIATTCQGNRQDGGSRAGAAWPTSRFTVSQGTVVDSLTDLVWLRNADCPGVVGWQQALNEARNLASGRCGLTDGSTAGQWRLPNRRELLGLTNFQQPDGGAWLNGRGFMNAANVWYWTSDSVVRNPAGKWVYHPVGALWGENDPGIEPKEFHALFVRDLAGALLSVTPATGNFGAAGVGGSVARNFTLSNTGAGALAVSGIALDGADGGMFAIDAGAGPGRCGSRAPTISAGGNCTITVTFTPATLGAKSALLHITSNAGNVAAGDIPLTGAGSANTISTTVSPVGAGRIACTPASPGSGVSCTVTPSPGYHINAVTVDSVARSVADPSAFIHQFGPVTSSHDISADFAADEMADAVKAYRYAVGKGTLTDGEKARYDVAPLGTDGRPDPDGTVGVGDIVIMLRRLADLVKW